MNKLSCKQQRAESKQIANIWADGICRKQKQTVGQGVRSLCILISFTHCFKGEACFPHTFYKLRQWNLMRKTGLFFVYSDFRDSLKFRRKKAKTWHHSAGFSCMVKYFGEVWAITFSKKAKSEHMARFSNHGHIWNLISKQCPNQFWQHLETNLLRSIFKNVEW